MKYSILIRFELNFLTSLLQYTPKYILIKKNEKILQIYDYVKKFE